MNLQPVTRLLGKISLAAKDKAPEIWAVVGVISGIAGVVTACKATLKFQEVLEDHNMKLEKLKEAQDKVVTGEIPVAAFSKADAKVDRRNIYIQTTWKAVKTYGPSIGLILLSYTSFGMSLHIKNVRYAGLGALYMSTLKDKEALEQSIVATYGADKLAELKDKQTTETKETHIDEKSGEEIVNKVSKSSSQLHTIFFDELSDLWEKDPKMSADLLYCKLNHATHVFFNKGYLFKNELLQIFGYDEKHFTQDGWIVGWKYYKDPAEAARHGAANFIDIGIHFKEEERHLNTPDVERFLQGLDNVVMLRLNCDPEPILGSIGWKRT